MENLPPNATMQDPEMVMLQNNKTDGYNYRQRRQDDWLENYTLNRDNVIVNRLTQRQTVNIPLMKTTLRTLLKDVDDLPVMYFENLDNDKEAEVYKNEYWKLVGEYNKFEILDIIDKRQVFTFGRSYDQWQVIDGWPTMTIVDPQDILVSRFVDPHNIHSSRFLIHTHIFTPLSELEENPDYDQEKVAELKAWYGTKMGIVKQASNLEMAEEKNKRMQQMGVPDVESPVLGETYVELSMHFVWRKEKDDKETQIYMYVEAESYNILMKKPLEEVLGVTKDHWWKTHYNYNSWADDVEKQDWYSDGIADIIRPSNKIVNVWFSQLVENRTMRSFGMNLYNSNLEGFAPQTFEPKAWGWVPIPVPADKNIAEVYQPITIPALTDSLEEMNFVIETANKASGAVDTLQGAQSERQITLGEVKLSLSEAQQRIKGMSKFYTQVWKERAYCFEKLLEAASDKLDGVTITKKGRNTDNIFTRDITPKDWETKLGYQVRIWSQDDKDAQDTQSLEKTSAVKQNMPDNPVVDKVYKRKLLEFGGFTPDEQNDAMKYEDEKRNAIMQQATMANGAASGQPGVQTPGQSIPPAPIQAGPSNVPPPIPAQQVA